MGNADSSWRGKISELSILSSFEPGRDEMSAAEIIAVTGLPRSSVFRDLKSLMQAGFILHDSTAKKYYLGAETLRLGMLAQRRLSDMETITQPLIELARATDETVTLSLLNPPSRTCVFVLESSSPLREVAQVGASYPLVQGAAGKAILAFLDEDLIRTIARSSGLSAAAVSQLLTELSEVRSTGLAVARGERVSGAFGIAAPVFLQERVFGSVTVVGPNERMAPVAARAEALVAEAARKVAERLSRRPAGQPGSK